MPKRYFYTSINSIYSSKKQILQVANTDLFNPLLFLFFAPSALMG